MHVPGYVTNGGKLGYYKGKNEGHFSIKNSSVSSTNIDDDEKTIMAISMMMMMTVLVIKKVEEKN